MKFYDGNEKLSNVIKRYYSDKEGNVYVEYLDGSCLSFNDNSREFIENLNKKMYLQLLDRNNSFNLNDEKRKYYFNMLTILFVLAVYITYVIKKECNFRPYALTFLLQSSFLNNKKNNYGKRIKEYEKAQMFLEMYKELNTPEGRMTVDSIFFDKIFGLELNANSLDEFSYGEVKDIFKRIKKIEHK